MDTNDTACASSAAKEPLSATLPLAKLGGRGQALALAQARFAAGMLAVALTAPACLDVLGDVDVGPAEPSIAISPNKPGGDAGACGDRDLSSGTCVINCTPGEGSCSGAVLQRCNESGDGWDLLDRCASAALCDSDALVCSRPACADGQHLCTAQGELLICRPDRAAFEHKEQCQSGAYCSSVTGREGCEGVACRAGRQRCNGAQIEQCRADRTGFDALGEPCASAALCKEGASGTASCEAPSCTACEPPPCTSGQQRCTANVLERCNATQTAFTPVATCESALLCDPSSSGCLTAPPPPPVVNTPYTFVSMSGSSTSGLGPLTLMLPAEWADIDSRPWTNARGETLGPRLIASTDAARFASRFDIPGVLFEATADAPVSASARLNELDLSDRCTPGAPVEYDDGLYFGRSQTWTNCSGTNATTVVVAAVPDDQSFVTIVIVTMVNERDEDARREIWESFVVQAPPP